MQRNEYMEQVLKDRGNLTLDELNQRCSSCPDELTPEQEDYYIAMIHSPVEESVEGEVVA